MVDLQVIEIRDLLDVIRVFPANVSPRSITVVGKDFRSAHEVLINEAKSPSVYVVNNSTILAQVPPSVGKAYIRSVEVVSHKLTNTERSKITFRIGDTTHGVSGIERLIQTFLKILLQTPGSDIFAQKIGGGLLRTVAKQTSRGGASIVSDLHMGVERTRRQIMDMQANDQSILMSERLLHARVLEAKFLPSELALVGKISIGNQANQRGLVALGL